MTISDWIPQQEPWVFKFIWIPLMNKILNCHSGTEPSYGKRIFLITWEKSQHVCLKPLFALKETNSTQDPLNIITKTFWTLKRRVTGSWEVTLIFQTSSGIHGISMVYSLCFHGFFQKLLAELTRKEVIHAGDSHPCCKNPLAMHLTLTKSNIVPAKIQSPKVCSTSTSIGFRSYFWGALFFS